MIKPTIGRRVWFRPSDEFMTANPGFTRHSTDQAMDAGVVYVHHDHMVNLTVADHVGRIWPVPSVRLLQGEESDNAQKDLLYCYCEWMPYQKGQAAKAD